MLHTLKGQKGQVRFQPKRSHCRRFAYASHQTRANSLEAIYSYYSVQYSCTIIAACLIVVGSIDYARGCLVGVLGSAAHC